MPRVARARPAGPCGRASAHRQPAVGGTHGISLARAVRRRDDRPLDLRSAPPARDGQCTRQSPRGVQEVDERGAAADGVRRARHRPRGEVTLVEHLEELRYRLLFCVAAVMVGSAVAFIFHDPILALLLRPLPAQAGGLVAPGGGHRIAVTGVGEAFAVVLKLSLVAGIALATPVWLYHLWAFVTPALRGPERRYALPFTILGVVLFVTGLGVGFVTLRYPLTWLLTFSDRSFVEIITADNYFTFVAHFLLAFGLTFELPLVVTGLVVMGIVAPDALRTHRVSILVALWTASCFITPGADPYSPLILGVAFTLLFFVSMGLLRFVRPGSAADPIQIAPPDVEVGRTGEVERVR